MKLDKNKILILSGDEIDNILSRDFEKIIKVVGESYIAHENGKTFLPHSVFLKFPNDSKNRIIGLPAYVENDFPVAGIKWISSFPDNISHNIDRASALIVLNATDTGRPYSVLEGSIISAKRTAASAALAANVILKDRNLEQLSLIGCGLINFEIFRFIVSQFKTIKNIFLYDVDAARAEQFSRIIKKTGHFNTTVCTNIKDTLRASNLICIATTASVPHITDKSLLQKGSLVLHVSLRDLSEETVKDNINVVDDIDHVNRENTSINLAYKKFGNTRFVHATLGQLILEKVSLP